MSKCLLSRLLLAVVLLGGSIGSAQQADGGFPPEAFIDPEHVLVGDEVLAVSPRLTEASEGSTEAAYIESGVERWPKGILPIAFSNEQGAIAAENIAMFFAACAQWSRRADVRCVRRTTEPAFITVSKGTRGCWSYVGFRPGARMELSEGSPRRAKNCWNQGTIMHEIGHALGLRHEHQRPDRDQYITIQWANIPPDWTSQYAYRKIQIQHITPYDFASIMHYPPMGAGGRDNFIINRGHEQYRGVVGQRKRISERDGQLIAAVYGKPRDQDLTLVAAEDEPSSEASSPEGRDDPLAMSDLAEDAAATDSVSEFDNIRRLLVFAWNLELVSDSAYEKWLKDSSLRLGPEASALLSPSRLETLSRSHKAFVAFLHEQFTQKGDRFPCPKVDAFLKNELKGSGRLRMDPERFPLQNWTQLLWKELAYRRRSALKKSREIGTRYLRIASLLNEWASEKQSPAKADALLCRAAKASIESSGVYAKAAPDSGRPNTADISEMEDLEKEMGRAVDRERQRQRVRPPTGP